MAQIREELVLYDRFTDTLTSYIKLSERAAGVTTQATQATEEFTQSQRQAANVTSGLTDRVKSLVGAYLGFQTVRGLFNLSDTITGITARLDMMNDGLQTTEELSQMIYESAMRSRGAYTETAAFVAKLGTLAGDAFDSNAEIIAFAEQINKQMALSGTTTMEAQAAMLQLTQGLASGTLRGEELNSVLEQTPMIAQTIARYMGVNTGEMRELASEGAITAEVVKNAMFWAAEETNAAFEQMPMTWGQVWTQMQNMAVQALQPVLGGINFLANNIEIIGPIVLGLGAAFAVFMVAANWTNICTAATTGLANAQKMLGAVMATTWGLPLIAIVLIITAIYTLTAVINQFAGTSVSATGIIAGGFLSLFTLIANGLIFVMNGFSAFGNFIGNVFRDPLGAVKVLFWDMATNVLGLISNVAHGVESLVNAIPGVEVNITSGIDNLYRQAQNAAQTAKDESGWVEYFKQQDYIDLTKAFQSGYGFGENLFSGGSTGTYGGVAYTPYDELTGQLGDISKSVGNIEKTVSMSDEDLKALVDVAERRYVNNINLTSQTPVINVNGANTGRTAADRQAIADAIQQILLEQTASGSVRSTARAY